MNLTTITIKKIKCFEYKKEDMDNINFHSAILLLKKKNDDRDWTIIFSDIISYNNKYYYGHFSRLNVMPYSSFEEMISTIEIREGLITYENESAAAPRYVEETEEISPPPPSIYDEDESDVNSDVDAIVKEAAWEMSCSAIEELNDEASCQGKFFNN